MGLYLLIDSVFDVTLFFMLLNEIVVEHALCIG
jgi:hypothetical protein